MAQIIFQANSHGHNRRNHLPKIEEYGNTSSKWNLSSKMALFDFKHPLVSATNAKTTITGSGANIFIEMVSVSINGAGGDYSASAIVATILVKFTLTHPHLLSQISAQSHSTTYLCRSASSILALPQTQNIPKNQIIFHRQNVLLKPSCLSLMFGAGHQ